MKKINNYLKKHYKLFIPFILILILFIGFFIYEKISNETINIKDNFYMYLLGEKEEYEATLTYDKKDNVTQMKIKSKTIEVDSTPIYYQDDKKVIFPREMSLVQPLKKSYQQKVDRFATITDKKNIYYLDIGSYHMAYANVFLYDGNNLYFLLDKTSLIVGEKVIELSPMSYVICNSQSSVEYYDYQNDKYEIIDITSEKVTIKTKYYQINVLDDSVIYKDYENLLVSNLSSLNNITK